MKTTIEVDEHVRQLLFTSLCYFDSHNDGEYDEWFGKDAGKVNESFHYLYSLSQEHSK